jgi:hypothetical protein
MQSVQTRARLTCPANVARTLFKLGCHDLLDLLLAWLTLLPMDRFLPQIAQLLAIGSNSAPFR